MRHRLVRLFVVVFCLSLGVTGSPALAQDSATPSFDLRHFQPSAGPFGVFTAEQSRVLDHLAFSARFIADYAGDPLVSRNGAGDETVLVSGVGSAHLNLGIGLFDIIEIAAVLPFVFYNEGTFDGQVLADSAVGDIHLVAKARALHPDDTQGFGLAGGLDISFPSGPEEDFLGDGFLTFRVFAAADYRIGPALLVANLGFVWREESRTQNAFSGPAMEYAIGAEYALIDAQLYALLEFFGAFPTSDAIGDDFTTPAEWMLGARVETQSNLHVFAGAGTGIGGAVGNPAYRVMLGVEYAPRDPDVDDDGILNADDDCPAQAEDVDGFKDEDGCPDLDNDGDALPDTADTCPDEAEDADGFQDDDGCPDPDSDGDGLDDAIDSCPAQAEDADGWEDEDGCPDPDNDADGVADGDDGCPDEAEDPDSFQDADGCPDHDNDGDGVPDTQDACSFDAEDFDGWEDEDGCPDVDNDLDGFCDPWVATSGLNITSCRETDACPDEAEVINGVEDTDGCPDEGKTLVKVTAKKIEILDKVYFSTGKSKIKKQSYAVLDQVVIALQNNVRITTLRIEGHTDNVGDADKNKKLSQERADAVKAYLIDKGIEPARLEAVGFGQEKPIDSNDTDEGRANNRRVEFNVVGDGE